MLPSKIPDGREALTPPNSSPLPRKLLMLRGEWLEAGEEIPEMGLLGSITSPRERPPHSAPALASEALGRLTGSGAYRSVGLRRL